MECGSYEFKQRYVMYKINTSGLRDYAESMKSFGVNVRDAARNMRQFCKDLDDSKKLK
jgi:hypothetical protein